MGRSRTRRRSDATTAPPWVRSDRRTRRRSRSGTGSAGSARPWAEDASLNEDTSPYDVTRRYFSGHRRRWASWGRAVGRHGPSLWFAAVVLVLSLSWVKACTSTPAQTPSSPRYHSRGYAHPWVT